MPIHDWSQVDVGLFHHFHQSWIVNLCNVLNNGVLPDDYYALAEQVVKGPVPDVLTLQTWNRHDNSPGGVALETTPLATRFTVHAEENIYVRKADRVTIRHRLGHVVAVLEIVSPGNKSSARAIRSFVDKIADLIDQGVHILIVDLFPPGPRDPQGIHKVIWDEIEDTPFQLPTDKPLTLVAYSAGELKTAYVEPVAVDDQLPDMPLFLEPKRYIPIPLEATYQSTWDSLPRAMKALVAAE